MDKIIYYTDELNDEFSDAKITPRVIDGSYVYVYKSLWKKFTHFFWLRIVAHPIAFCYLKFKYHHKFINKKVIKPYKKDAYFLYGNHTHNLCDAFIPPKISGWTDAHVIVNPENVSIKGMGNVVLSLGAIPLPADRDAMKNFIACIETRVKERKVIAIYPEAHIWPYYTKIRPFKDMSFRYPIEYNKPVFSFTNVYLKRKHGKTPTIHTYIDGPFFPDLSISKPEARKKLRDMVYNQMVERSKENTVEVIKHMKKEESND